MFAIRSLDVDQQQEMQQKNVWNSLAPIPMERLKKVSFKHYTLCEDKTQEGELIVLDVVAPSVLGIMQTLFDQQFPIHSAKPVEAYDGNDDRSMAANNSSAFNCRKITGTDMLSIHSYGLAIDINPEQNPFLVPAKTDEIFASSIHIFPAQGVRYLNRQNQRPGMVERIVPVFRKYGFNVWGGNWDDLLDYHHFQTSREMAERLAALPYEEGVRYFESSLSGFVS